MDTKYITFKIDDWKWNLSPEMKEFAAEFEVEDAVVIRKQDVFASGAFFNYSSSVVTSMETIQAVLNAGAGAPLLHNTMKELQSLADYFHELGVEAAAATTKLPD